MKKILLMCLVVGLVGCGNSESTKIKSENTAKVQQDVVEKPLSEKPSPQKQNWEYQESKDEMRGTIKYNALSISENEIFFDSPYGGGSRLAIVLKKVNNDPTDVMFLINNGQFSCDTIGDNCFATFKFDNGELQIIALSGTEDHSSDALFIRNQRDADEFISTLKLSKKLIIELPFYQHGKKQFTFNPVGLKWDTPKTVKKNEDKIVKSAAISDQVLDDIVNAAIDAAEATSALAGS